MAHAILINDTSLGSPKYILGVVSWFRLGLSCSWPETTNINALGSSFFCASQCTPMDNT